MLPSENLVRVVRFERTASCSQGKRPTPGLHPDRNGRCISSLCLPQRLIRFMRPSCNIYLLSCYSITTSCILDRHLGNLHTTTCGDLVLMLNCKPSMETVCNLFVRMYSFVNNSICYPKSTFSMTKLCIFTFSKAFHN